MDYKFRPSGVCSTLVEFSLEDGVIHNVRFTGGCNGNLKAIAKLVEGRKAEEVKEILKGNTCGPRSTSCADQFSKALQEALDK